MSQPPGPARPARERIVLAQRRGARVVRTSVEVEEQTQVGEVLVHGLMRAQLAVALRWSLLVVVVVAALPLLAALAPDFVSGNLLGVRWFWLVLGFAAYPALLLVGWRFIRHAERVEQDFADMVDN